MTIKEFQDKVTELIHELNKKDGTYDVFVSVMNVKTKTVSTSGFGCAACHVDMIVDEHIYNERYQHSKSPITH